MSPSTEHPIRVLASGRLLGIDSLRGVAALGVVLYHAQGGFSKSGVVFATPGAWANWTRGPMSELPARLVNTLLSFGFTGVFLFFVISGFCIHMRWARARVSGQALGVPFLSFWRRRIRRLYPPYLVALSLYVVLEAARGSWHPTAFNLWDVGLHLVMCHNLDPRTVYTINGVFWTLALEEQLYLAYFILLWLRARLDWGWTLLICLMVRIAWFAGGFLLHRWLGLEIVVHEAALANWLVWALGAVAVEAALGIIHLPTWCKDSRLAAALLLLGAILSCVERGAQQASLKHTAWLLATPVWGVGFFIILNRVVAWEMTRQKHGPRLIVGLFAGLGLFSYSLYLIHELVLSDLPLTISRWLPEPWRPGPWVSLLVLAPLSVLTAWGFFRVFERPFLSQAVQIAAVPRPHPFGSLPTRPEEDRSTA